MSEWQPIDTAPKGVPVDIWAKKQIVKDNWSDHPRRFVNHLRFPEWQEPPGGWIDAERCVVLSPAWIVTHWMPLPEPPE